MISRLFKAIVPIILIGIFASTYATNVKAQYLNFFAGPKLPEYNKSNLILAYTDESPATDVFYSNKNLDNEIFYSCGIEYDNFSHEHEMYLNLVGDVYVGELFGVNFGVSGGYPLYLTGGKNITLLPVLTTAFGFVNKSIGELINNTTYIQVNNTIFANGENVDVSLERTGLVLKPNLNLLIDLSKKLQLRLSGSYVFDVNTNESIHFSGKNNSGEPIHDDEDINSSNITYYVNGAESNSIPFNIDGFEFALGLAINLGKDKPKNNRK